MYVTLGVVQEVRELSSIRATMSAGSSQRMCSWSCSTLRDSPVPIACTAQQCTRPSYA